MSYQSRERVISAISLCSTALPARPGMVRRMLLTLAVWRERTRMRRQLGRMDARSLRDIGISPATAAFEAGKPFWRDVGELR